MKKYISIVSCFLVACLCLQCHKEDTNNYPSLEGPEGTTGNLFSISSNRKVYFSKGNLQYQASTNTWRFAENQWEVIGAGNVNISSTYSGWIDLFVYGTSGYDGVFPYLTELPSEKTYVAAMDISGTNYDWGTYNPISNGGNQVGLWRILNKDEMIYLLSRCDLNGNHLSGKGTLTFKDGNRIDGIIIMPDNYIGEHNTSFNWGEISVDELNNWGGVFISPLSGNLETYQGEVHYYEMDYIHVSSNYPFENPEYPSRKEYFKVGFGAFYHPDFVCNLGAAVRLVQDYEQ